MRTFLLRLKKGLKPALIFAGTWVGVAAIMAVLKGGFSEHDESLWTILLFGLIGTFVFYLPLGLLPFLFGQEYQEPEDWRIDGARPYVWGAVVLGVALFVWFVML